MLVMNFHAFPNALPGGFIGVDVFFVISGFLITGIITRELELGRFSLVEFYNRRIRRIFPALIVVLSATLALGWFWMLPQAFAQLGSDSFASAAFLANIALLLQSGYFDIESAKKPLLHLWSLGIEEQFYLFWPLLLMLAARFRMSIMAMACDARHRLFPAQRGVDRLKSDRGLLSAVHARVRIADRRGAGLRLDQRQSVQRGEQLARLDRRGADRRGGRHTRQPPRLSGLVGGAAGRRAARFCCPRRRRG